MRGLADEEAREKLSPSDYAFLKVSPLANF